jgi:hypothetical protein
MLGWQESYLDNSNRLSARCAPGDVPALAPYDAVDHEHGRPSPGPLELAVAVPQEASASEEAMLLA